MANPKQSLFARGKNAVINTLTSIKDSVQTKWEKYHITNYTIAISTATSTLKLSIRLLPIIVEALTTVAILQLLQFLLPSILFTPWFYIPVMLMVSGYIGYNKYHELIERAKLDHQIVENEKKITASQEINKKLGKTVADLQAELTATKKSLNTLNKLCDAKKPLRNNAKQVRPVAIELRRSERLRAKV
ncbi:MAG: hypothetical protein AB7I18_07890 [Candidatus Berkiella sp.]